MRVKEETRFFEKITESGDCWIWLGAVSNSGYGSFWSDNKSKLAHRWSYSFFRGDLLGDLHLDHLCRNKLCCNPEHLDPVTNKINISRGLLGDLYVRPKSCSRGHLFDDQNTYISKKTGKATCRRCHALRQRGYKRSA